jgi:hypothetical protein
VTVTRPAGGGEIQRGPGGVVREVRTPAGAVIHYAPDGLRRVEVARPDGRVLVASPGGRVGYVQRPLTVQGQVFVQRTYVSRGATVALVYRPWPYHGVNYQVYQPSRYYRPAYYTWTCQPWRQPVYYGWGWGGAPWFYQCRGYWHPYPYYVSPVFWLADFCLAVTFEEAYENRQDCSAPPPPPPPTEMSPAAQQAIADEVRRQIQDEQAQQQGASQGNLPAPSGAPPMFSDNVSRIFMVYTGVPAYLNGLEYFLTEGDVLQLKGAPAPNASYANVSVLASRTPGVPVGSMVSVGLQDLQEMQNHMMAIMDQGMQTLQTQQGQNGLPAVPPQNLGMSNAPYLGGVQPDPNAAAELSQTAAQASQSGQGMLAQAPAPGAPPTSPQTVALGMTPDEVHRILGTPKQAADLGAKQIEVYPSLKVTYQNGKVTDVQ